LAVEDAGGTAGGLGYVGEILSQSSCASNGLFVQPGDRTAKRPIAAKNFIAILKRRFLLYIEEILIKLCNLGKKIAEL